MSDVETSKPAGYQGWKNYETWAVNLWISNDQGMHEHAVDEAAERYREAVSGGLDGNREQWTEAAALELARFLEAEIDSEEACLVLSENSVYTDLLRSTLEEVSWFEIAEAYVENLDRDEIEADEFPEDRDTSNQDENPAYDE